MIPGRAARVALGALAIAWPARAGTFAPDGTFAFDPTAVVSVDFEAYPDGLDATAAGYELVDDASALSGSRAAKVAPYQGAEVKLALPAGDGSYLARAWVKGDGFLAVGASYDDASIAPVLSQLWPTGRVTSDGWIELESAEFSVEAARGPHVGLSMFGPEGVVVDAAELVASGEFRSARTCLGVKDTQSCRSDELCLHRRCLDARGLVPPVPKAQQAALAAWLRSRLTALFGPYANRRLHLPAALALMSKMESAPDRVAFFGAFTAAIGRLRDSHSSTFATWQFSLEVPGRVPFNACFLAGHADVEGLPAPDPARPHVLVGRAGAVGAWGLRTGDRVVAIDGEDPIDWVRALESRRGDAPSVNDPESVAAFLEPLGPYVSSLAQTLTVVRCDAAKGSCGPEETLLVASQIAPTEPIDRVECDNRLGVHVEGVPASGPGGRAYGSLATESTPTERVFGLVWNSLDGSVGSKVKKDILTAVKSWRDEPARGVILDHRTGNGGTIDTGMPILAFATPKHLDTAFVWRSRADEEGPADAAAGHALFERHRDKGLWPSESGSNNASLDVPVAMLLTRDVSASDYLPRSLKGASPNVRLFGPNPTNGAFSTFLGGQYWTGLTFQLACGDTIAGETGEALCGEGVRPDVVVLPAQSALLQGRDPLYDAGYAWVKANLAP